MEDDLKEREPSFRSVGRDWGVRLEMPIQGAVSQMNVTSSWG